jgi:ubiquitin C-terminal hydrolase
MTRVKVKPKYKELQGDPSKDSVRNIANEWWNYGKQRDDSVVCDYFQGQTECTILCSECKFRSVSFDNFWGLPVSFGVKGSGLQ